MPDHTDTDIGRDVMRFLKNFTDAMHRSASAGSFSTHGSKSGQLLEFQIRYEDGPDGTYNVLKISPAQKEGELILAVTRGRESWPKHVDSAGTLDSDGHR
jgi:hypothetical protein